MVNQSTLLNQSTYIEKEDAIRLLEENGEFIQYFSEASQLRRKYFGNKVQIHILDNIKNGYCPEDCGYCAQRKNGDSGIQEYPMKSNEEIFEDAKKAKDNGAFRFCIVTAGTGPNEKTVHKLSEVIGRIHSELQMKVCLSAGLLDEEKAKLLKESGLNRYNHNLNTSESFYPEICDTHTYKDRVNTLRSVRNAGIELCSGIIVGMGETSSDIVEVAFDLKSQNVESIPVNFFIPIGNHAIKNPNTSMTPEYCLRVLTIFRLINPEAEIRIGAGREGYLRNLQAMSLFVANSLFISGYLNVKGSDFEQSLEMIYDAGFEPDFPEGIDSEYLIKMKQKASFLYSKENIKKMYKHEKV